MRRTNRAEVPSGATTTRGPVRTSCCWIHRVMATSARPTTWSLWTWVTNSAVSACGRRPGFHEPQHRRPTGIELQGDVAAPHQRAGAGAPRSRVRDSRARSGTTSVVMRPPTSSAARRSATNVSTSSGPAAEPNSEKSGRCSTATTSWSSNHVEYVPSTSSSRSMATTAPPQSANHWPSVVDSAAPAPGSIVTRRHPAPATSSSSAVVSPRRTRPCTNSSPATGSPARTMPVVTPGRGGTACGVPVSCSAMAASPRRGLLGVADADDRPERHRELDDGADVVVALGLVDVEQLGGGPPGQHEVELPGQVGRIAQARAHALPRERRHLVGGIAGQQHVAPSPLVGPSGLEPVHGVAFERGVGRRHVPRREQLPGPVRVVELVGGLVGQAHELPPSPTGATGHDGRRPARLADLEVDRVEHPRLVQGDVDDQPVVEEPEIGDGDADEIADRAVGPVAAHDVARPHLLRTPSPSTRR